MAKKQVSRRELRQIRIRQILFVVVAILIILAMVLGSLR
jgi:predicted nucleic acid-binding Zn ribbon protein